jgi:hypothetical protein
LDFDNAYHSYRLFRWFGAFSKKERMTSVSEELIDGECQAIPTEEEITTEYLLVGEGQKHTKTCTINLHRILYYYCCNKKALRLNSG